MEQIINKIKTVAAKDRDAVDFTQLPHPVRQQLWAWFQSIKATPEHDSGRGGAHNETWTWRAWRYSGVTIRAMSISEGASRTVVPGGPDIYINPSSTEVWEMFDGKTRILKDAYPVFVDRP